VKATEATKESTCKKRCSETLDVNIDDAYAGCATP